MSVSLADWTRPYFERPGGRPFLFYVVYGSFPKAPTVDSQRYRSQGIHRGLGLSLYDREEYPEVLAGFQVAYPWDELMDRDPELAGRISGSDLCLVLRGELDDQDNVELLPGTRLACSRLMDQGGICVYDPQMFYWSRVTGGGKSSSPTAPCRGITSSS